MANATDLALVTAGLTGYATLYTPAFQMLWIEKLESRIGEWRHNFMIYKKDS